MQTSENLGGPTAKRHRPLMTGSGNDSVRMESHADQNDAVTEGIPDSPMPVEAEPHSFPVEEIVQHPLPGYTAPIQISFSPDDSLISYLFSPDGSLSRKLYGYSVEGGAQALLVTPPGGGVEERSLTTAEKLRRERLREQGLGITRYDWAKGGPVPRLLIPLPSGIYVQDGLGAELRLRASSSAGAPILDPQLSPNGASIAYVQEEELYVVSAVEGEPQQLTFGARGTQKSHGLAEYIAQEEMERRSGFWWSLDSRHIAYTEIDAGHIPMYRIVHQGKPSVGADTQEDHPYPFPGQENVRVRLGVVPATGGATTWMDLECGRGGVENAEMEYLARVTWMPDGSLIVQVENRLQTRLRLWRFDPASGRGSLVMTEESDVWINLHDCLFPLSSKGGLAGVEGAFLWASERSGFRHLYIHDRDGSCLGAVTAGDWQVDSVAAVDEEHGLIYFTGTMDGPLECHLYVAPLQPHKGQAPPTPRKLTSGSGRHSIIIDHKARRFVDVHDSIHSPPCVTLRQLSDGSAIASIYDQSSGNTRVRRLKLVPPEIVQFQKSDGTILYGAIYRPDPNVFGPPPYKTVISVYGGPHVQTVVNSWMMSVDMRAQYLRNRGILVWKLDNRGSLRRGLAFEGALKYRMGTVDVEDQGEGLTWLVERGLANPRHVGIYGWSYGGYMAAIALAKLNNMLRCAVAGAPVTSWDGYDTHYTERYMGLPHEQVEAYTDSSVMTHVEKIKGKLMLVHGMIDENVHFRHTARLVKAMTAAAKVYELLIFPDERHMPRGLRDKMYMEKRIFDFLNRNL